MATEGEVWVQLATRIPKQLHRELKLYCVKSDVSVMDFVVSALRTACDAHPAPSTTSPCDRTAWGPQPGMSPALKRSLTASLAAKLARRNFPA